MATKYGMTEAQIQAASHAMNGVSAHDLMLTVLFMVGALATTWLLMNFVALGAWQERQKRGYGEIAYPFAIALFTWIVTGVLIFY